jgi:hypothetical protein
MEFNLLTLVVVGLGLMFFGYFFGLFEGRAQGAKKRKNEEELNKSGKGAVESPLPPPNPSVPPLENNLLALSLNDKNHPQLKLDGQLVDASRLSPDNRKRLIDLMLMMRPWIENSSGQKQAVASQVTQPVPPPSTQPVPPPVTAVPTPVAVKPAPPKTSGPVTVPVPAPEPAPNSMVTQIDAILQARLIGTPLEQMGIRLIESAKGDPLVLVGDKSYTGVGEVSDPAVQAAIRAAIAEWERKYTPGY